MQDEKEKQDKEEFEVRLTIKPNIAIKESGGKETLKNINDFNDSSDDEEIVEENPYEINDPKLPKFNRFKKKLDGLKNEEIIHNKPPYFETFKKPSKKLPKKPSKKPAKKVVIKKHATHQYLLSETRIEAESNNESKESNKNEKANNSFSEKKEKRTNSSFTAPLKKIDDSPVPSSPTEQIIENTVIPSFRGIHWSQGCNLVLMLESEYNKIDFDKYGEKNAILVKCNDSYKLHIWDSKTGEWRKEAENIAEKEKQALEKLIRLKNWTFNNQTIAFSFDEPKNLTDFIKTLKEGYTWSQDQNNSDLFVNTRVDYLNENIYSSQAFVLEKISFIDYAKYCLLNNLEKNNQLKEKYKNYNLSNINNNFLEEKIPSRLEEAAKKLKALFDLLDHIYLNFNSWKIYFDDLRNWKKGGNPNLSLSEVLSYSYVNDYETFKKHILKLKDVLKEIKQKIKFEVKIYEYVEKAEELAETLDLTHLPFVSEGKIPRHCLLYAFNLKKYKDKSAPDPLYGENCKPKKGKIYLGKFFITKNSHDLFAVENKVVYVPESVEKGRIDVSSVIVGEMEIQHRGANLVGKIAKSINIKVPKFHHAKAPARYKFKYGLDEARYQHFKQAFKHLIAKAEYGKLSWMYLETCLLAYLVEFHETQSLAFCNKMANSEQKNIQWWSRDKKNKKGENIEDPYPIGFDECDKKEVKRQLFKSTGGENSNEKSSVNEKIAFDIQQLENIGLKFQPIPGDGNCLYNAVAIHFGLDQQVLRQAVANKLKEKLKSEALENKKEIASFIQANVPKNETIESYLNNIEHGNEWADNLEIFTLMQCLQRPIVIVGQDGVIKNPDDIEKFEGQPPIFVLYNGRDHYDGFLVTEGLQPEAILKDLLAGNWRHELLKFGNFNPQSNEKQSANKKDLKDNSSNETEQKNKSKQNGENKKNPSCQVDSIDDDSEIESSEDLGLTQEALLERISDESEEKLIEENEEKLSFEHGNNALNLQNNRRVNQNSPQKKQENEKKEYELN